MEDYTEIREAPDFASLGDCCACGRNDETVRNIIALPRKSPIAGRGWGCAVCGVPGDGAIAVVCDECLALDLPLVNVCCGYPGVDGRIPIGELSEEIHKHDLWKHPELEGARRCRACGCTDECGCFDLDCGPCFWVEATLCSHCC